MAVITLTITESPIQLVSGIPKTISLSTNVPSTIFYTLDDSEPTDDSEIFVSAITLPTDKPSVTLKAFATDGIDTSIIVEKIFRNDDFANMRTSQDKIFGLNVQPLPGPDLSPFGSNSPNLPFVYGNIAREIVDSPDIENIPDGYDGTATGTSANGTDKPLTSYQFRFSETNSKGERGNNIGTLPAKIKVHVPAPPSTQSDTNNKLFNPKSLVIFQDGTKPPQDSDVTFLNRPYFFLENVEKARDGSNFFNSGLDGSLPTGSLLRQYYNPREQTITYYYFDSLSLRWIISKEPYKPKSADVFSLDKVVFPSSEKGSRYVFKWIPFKRSHLI